jgi:hypothetical protein
VAVAFAAALAACSKPVADEQQKPPPPPITPVAEEPKKPATPPFNLHCEGVRRLGFNDLSPDPFVATLRIDLASEVWCVGECKEIYKIITNDDKNITLVMDSNNSRVQRVYINRLTGEYRDETTYIQNGTGIGGPVISAQCEKQPFTGFPPPPKQKF